MDSAQKLIQAIASLLWPLIAIFLFFRFKPAIAAIIDSARSRKFTIKIGGQELTMEEANQVQQKLIADLQDQVSEIQKKLNPLPEVAQPAAAATSPAPHKISSILWVDDSPKNNSYFIQQLMEQHITVDLARSTAEGIGRINLHNYDCILSDMARDEDGIYNPAAGIDLLKLVREKFPQTPFVIYTSSDSKKKYGPLALKLGATAITSSPTELFGILDFAFL